MNILSRLIEKIREDLSLKGLFKVVLVLMIVWLFQATGAVWNGLLSMIWNIFRPFIFGFVIAYVLRYPVRIGEKKGIPRKVMIPLVYIVILAILAWILSSLVPTLADRSASFINSIISGVRWISSQMEAMYENGVPDFISRITNAAVEMLSDVKGIIPNLPGLLTQTLSIITISLFSVIISIFMMFSWEKIKNTIFRISMKISPKFHQGLISVNGEISDYIRSMLILMVIRAVEYALLYFLVGNTDWLILAILTAVSILIPYIGPTFVNLIGILTSLTLPTGNIIALIVMILVLSNVDEYVVSPIVHSRNTNTSPLMALFALFAGNTILGIPGIMIAIPAMLAIRVIFRMYSEPSAETKEEVKS